MLVSALAFNTTLSLGGFPVIFGTARRTFADSTPIADLRPPLTDRFNATVHLDAQPVRRQ